ncbi:heptaprenyl diphosphate synthase [Actinocrispum wychmicini]|uniref:Heptaprenyl diphosphate synthase n=2 Tax=Actinocrispum wychmicini TaxID=1213861 RepID=A0A4R2KD56_9PSEU|nr:heptaprenyl diphosphate synthase [Actinocrispum wychmicini]
MVTAQRFPGPLAAVESAGVHLADDLDLVEQALRAVVRDADNAFISSAAGHLIDAGGKRFRPMMALLGAHFGPSRTQIVEAAAMTELVHVATLYHDDVMDEAPVRHGVITANARWSNTIAVLLGDYLLARAAELGAGLGDAVLKLQLGTLRRLVRGQVNETVGPLDGVDRSGHCLRVMSDKSASLIAMAVRLGAMVSGADEHVARCLELYGELLGTAFQISDDVLDIAATEAELGKKPGTDLREGIVTLPVLYAVEDDPALADVVLAGPITDDDCRAFALELLRPSAGLRRARQEVVRYAERARDMLHDIPDIPARAALSALCDFVAVRTS